MELLRFATAGSVDDGKSTLIGRLLYDSKQIFEDQLDAVEQTSRDRGYDYTNLALLTDGLRAEREQGITIDVAYRYFATPSRKFIIADTPGHVQYTRNMVTGASTADAALVLVDARNGIVEQSRRHAVIASLLRVRHLVVLVNKMDLVAWDREVYDTISAEALAFAAKLGFDDALCIPISALHGDNVLARSAHTPWYGGPALLEHLEGLDVATDHAAGPGRFPVQYVVRPLSHDHHDYRGYAGAVAGGVLRPGDDVVVLPSGRRTTVAAVDVHGGPIDEAAAPMSVSLRLADDVDVSRGDLIAHATDVPLVTQDIEAQVCWFNERPLRERTTYAIKHATRSARAMVRDLHHRIDVNTLDEVPTDHLAMNELGRVTLRTTVALCVDPYAANRTTGSFILVDEATNETVGAGMIVGPAT